MFEVQNISVLLGTKKVLHDVSLTLHSGEVLAIVGPNGAGKSTLLSIMSGALTPLAGRVLIDDEDVSTLRTDELARRRAVLEQTPRRDIPFSAETLVGLAIPAEISPADAAEITAQVLETVGLSDMLSRPIDRMSGGEAHRAHLARALAQLKSGQQLGHAGHLLVDEPTASLDLVHQSSVCNIAQTCAAGGAGVLMILHDLTLAAAVADRVALLDQGRLVAIGPPRSVLTAETIERTYKIPVSTHVIDEQIIVLPHFVEGQATHRKLAS